MKRMNHGDKIVQKNRDQLALAPGVISYEKKYINKPNIG